MKKKKFFATITLLFIGIIFIQSINAVSINNPKIPLITPGINYSLIPTVNNSMFLNGHPDTYFYPASNPYGFISSYTESDPYYFSNPNNYLNDSTATSKGYAKYQFTNNNFNGSGDFNTTGNVTIRSLGINTPINSSNLISSSYSMPTANIGGILNFNIFNISGGVTSGITNFYGNSFNTFISGNSYAFAYPTKNVYNNYNSILDTSNLGSFAQPIKENNYLNYNLFNYNGTMVDTSSAVQLLVYGNYKNLNYNSGLPNSISDLFQYYGDYNLIGGNFGTTGITEHYGTYNLITGTADTNFGVYNNVSGATINYGIYNVNGDNVLGFNNGKSYFGTSKSSSIYYDGVDMIINPKEVGSGKLTILGNANVTNNITADIGNFNTAVGIGTSAVPSTKGLNILKSFSTGNAYGVYVSSTSSGASPSSIYGGSIYNGTGGAGATVYALLFTSSWNPVTTALNPTNQTMNEIIGTLSSAGFSYPFAGTQNMNVTSMSAFQSGGTLLGDMSSGHTANALSFKHYEVKAPSQPFGATINNQYGFYAPSLTGGNINNYGFYSLTAKNSIASNGGKWLFGASEQSSIYYDGVDMIINPKEVGSGQLKVLGSTNISNNLTIEGNLSVRVPYSVFTDNTTQNMLNVSQGQSINFSTIEDNYNINLIGKQNITVAQDGDYHFIISSLGICNSNNKHINIWWQKNGVNVARSNTIQELNTANVEALMTIPFIIDLNSTDTLRIMWNADSIGCSLEYITNSSFIPETPSAILTINRIGDV